MNYQTIAFLCTGSAPDSDEILRANLLYFGGLALAIFITVKLNRYAGKITHKSIRILAKFVLWFVFIAAAIAGFFARSLATCGN
ncbi:TPA: hypothetical protein EYO12_01975 [Candidatus Saccharibacteria bacterium]|nr:hypothetical protein [Candidatus Saccharibacteria bacterium]HIO87485.1 hypothetical protein [Candidatus Saccharibacteria bacterium]